MPKDVVTNITSNIIFMHNMHMPILKSPNDVMWLLVTEVH
jgi:hypothetical protein